MKTYLLDEEIIILGATTNEEVNYFQKDLALKRRFSFLKINPLNKEFKIEAILGFIKSVSNSQNCNNSDLENFCLNKSNENYELDTLLDFADFYLSYREIKRMLKIEQIWKMFISNLL